MNPLRPPHIRTTELQLKERVCCMKMKMTDFLLLSILLLLLALFGLD